MHKPPKFSEKPNDIECYIEMILEEEKKWFDILYHNKPWPNQDRLAQKVCTNKKLVPYYGDTVVFKLLPDQIELFKSMQSEFRQEVKVLAEPLVPETFHMTLHDLNNGPSVEILEGQCKANIIRVEECFKYIATQLKENPEYRYISFDFSSVYPSHFIVSTVSMLPSSVLDFNLSMNLYQLFDEIMYLPRPLFPHITLDYWSLDAKDADKKHIIYTYKKMNARKFSIKLDLHQLAYQHFTHMNDYRDIFLLKDFL